MGTYHGVSSGAAGESWDPVHSSILQLIIFGGIFFLEIGSVVVQVGWFKFTRIRTGTGQRLLRCSPLHHHFHLGGWSEQQGVTRFWLITIVLSMAAFALVKLR